jgi:hypothetical protein
MELLAVIRQIDAPKVIPRHDFKSERNENN